MILIVSDAADIQVPFVTRHLKTFGVPHVQLNVSEFPQRISHTSIWRNGNYKQRLTLPNSKIDCSEIQAVWYRKPEMPQVPAAIEPNHKEYAFDETKADLEGLYSHLGDRFWISPIDRIRRASNKPLQLELASKLGFSTPDTIITNSPEDAVQFYRDHNGEVVYKTISGGVLYTRPSRWAQKTIHGNVYTTPVNLANKSMFQSVALCPCMFQEYIRKQFEVRVTVVLDEVFAAKIHSQEHPAAEHDWRRGIWQVRHTVHELPSDVAALCRALVRRLGLNFGAIDLIYSTDDRYVFLEINPNGQYGWIEGATGLPISEALARALLSAEQEPSVGLGTQVEA